MTAERALVPAAQQWTNWGRNQSAVPVATASPRSVDELRDLVSSSTASGRRVKAVGAGHSFSAIAVPVDIQVDLENLRGLLAVDAGAATATFAAGTHLYEVPGLLAPHGLAMENLGDIDNQSIAGAISTGTHGSGAGFGGLATQVVALTLVTADGNLLSADRRVDSGLVSALAVGLGALGVIVEVTLQCVPAFPLHAHERNEPLATLLPELRARGEEADHLDVYWFPHTSQALVKTNTRRAPGTELEAPSAMARWVDDELLGNRLYGLLCRLGSAAPWAVPGINRLATAAVAQREYTDQSHRVFVADRDVRFVEQEYALPAEKLAEALERVRALIDRHKWRISFPIELRFSAGDELWLSTAHGRPTGYLAVHRYWREPFEEYFSAVEEICVALGGRPHWGKFHTRTADQLRLMYPRFDDFVSLRDRLDPTRTFANGYLDQVLGE